MAHKGPGKVHHGHGHGHEHIECCGMMFHGREQYEQHRKKAHPEK